MSVSVTITENSALPKVRQIEQQLREKIISGELPKDTKLPSMRLMANEIGVSIGIVKQAFNTLTIEGYLHSKPKVGLFVSSTRPTRHIALVLPSVELEQIPRIVQGVRAGLPAGYRLIIEAASNDYDGEIDILRHMDASHIQGIVLMPPEQQRYATVLRDVLASAPPCVQILYEIAGLPADSATYDGYETGYMAMSHLLQAGHRNIGLVATDADDVTSLNRNQGLDAALQQVGMRLKDLPVERSPANRLSGEQPALLGQKNAFKLLKREPKLTAVIGENQHLTLGIYSAAMEMGKRIPEDLSLVSMGVDLPAFQHMSPSITAIDEPLDRICRRATQMLIDRITEPQPNYRSIHFPPVLISRDSVRKISGS